MHRGRLNMRIRGSHLRIPTLRAVLLTSITLSGVLIPGCTDHGDPVSVSITLRNTGTYHYQTVGGDEEGARIVTQAQHYSISEIRRNAETHWVAVYVYQPAPGFVGRDYVQLEIMTGSDGASPPAELKRVGIAFNITG